MNFENGSIAQPITYAEASKPLQPNIVHANCQPYLAGLEKNSIDMCITDPPYGTGNTTNKAINYRENHLAEQGWTPFFAEWDGIPKNEYYKFSLSWLRPLYRAMKPGGTLIACGTHHNIPRMALAMEKVGFWTVQWISWYKPNAMPHRAGKQMKEGVEILIWAEKKGAKRRYNAEAAKTHNGGKNLTNMWSINQDTRIGAILKELYGENHPSKKPEALFHRALDVFLPKAEGQTVIDPFAGTGVTAVAAARLGLADLNVTLIDNHLPYVELMKRRLTEKTSV